ncbi:hypothetical protein IAQ61_001096 [Plenodomus lingam]|uniref:uncharacterized protein n=1 Tax=Leptosphaeria maculans TaxID=5022 RepID=UPI0033269DEB|nr:hypothetical protein IAQ61_001096 [Plenodomus lingam]
MHVAKAAMQGLEHVELGRYVESKQPVSSQSMEIPEKLFLAMAPTQMAIGFGSCFGQTLTILGTCVEDKWTNRV